jgi:hypothetical protein
MVNSYLMVNPHIEGDFKKKIKAKNSKEAAQKFYKELSGHFSNAVPTFHFTIQKGGSGSGNHYHFEVTENRKDQKVDFNIRKIDLKDELKVLDKFKNRRSKWLKEFQAGGKKKSSKKSKKDDSSDSSDSSSDEAFIKRAKKNSIYNQPLYYWWYDPYLYSLDTVYVPTFYSYVTPYIQLALY